MKTKRKIKWSQVLLSLCGLGVVLAIGLGLFVHEPVGVHFGENAPYGKQEWIGLLPLKYNCCLGYSGCGDCGGCGESYLFAHRFLWFAYIPERADLELPGN